MTERVCAHLPPCQEGRLRNGDVQEVSDDEVMRRFFSGVGHVEYDGCPAG